MLRSKDIKIEKLNDGVNSLLDGSVNSNSSSSQLLVNKPIILFELPVYTVCEFVDQRKFEVKNRIALAEENTS